MKRSTTNGAASTVEYPPRDEVAALWAACRPVTDDAEVTAWLRSRGPDPGTVEDRDLARALPLEASLPRWARYQGRTWTETGHRCLLPTFDETGAIRGLRARRVVGGEGPKALAPAGHSAVGLVLANGLARQLLSTRAAPRWWPADAPLRAVIGEGEPDFLALAAGYSDAGESAPAVLGLPGSGAWTEAIAGCIPDWVRVTVATHHDAAGDAYAAKVYASLRGRCPVYRIRERAMGPP